jgi:hypothetical protein
MVCSEDVFRPRLGVLGVPLITLPDMIVPNVKFVMHGSLAYKNVCCGGYLSSGKQQSYHVEKTSNLPQTYLPTKPFAPTLLMDISGFFVD